MGTLSPSVDATGVAAAWSINYRDVGPPALGAPGWVLPLWPQFPPLQVW
jgi:hypothetical protein